MAVAWSVLTRLGTVTCGSRATATETGSVFFASEYSRGVTLTTVPGSKSSR